jgi:hypothetical protein
MLEGGCDPKGFFNEVLSFGPAIPRRAILFASPNQRYRAFRIAASG